MNLAFDVFPEIGYEMTTWKILFIMWRFKRDFITL